LDPGGFGTKGPLQYLAERWLVTESGVSFHWLVTVLERRCSTVALSIADDLLCAIGKPDALGIEVQVVANPMWARSRVERELRRRGIESDDKFWDWSEHDKAAVRSAA
jgi:hypothetical protein